MQLFFLKMNVLIKFTRNKKQFSIKATFILCLRTTINYISIVVDFIVVKTVFF